MNTIQNLFQQAQLAEASYANFFNNTGGLITTGDELINALRDEGFSDAQANDFVTRWNVVDQYTAPSIVGVTGSGFSTTVFKSTDGQYVMAIRGTQAFNDLRADVAGIGSDGIAINQTIDLFNYYQRLNNNVGADIVQYEYHPAVLTVPAYISTTHVLNNGPDAGWLVGHNFEVTGHSLGGHLALAMGRLAPDRVQAVYTYNAPGFDSLLGFVIGGFPMADKFFALLRNTEISATGQSQIGLAFDSTKSANLVVPSDVIHDIGNVPGVQTPIFTDSDGSDPFTSHQVGYMTDALALQSVLGALDPSIAAGDQAGMDKASDLLKAAANTQDASLETLLDDLRTLFQDNYTHGRSGTRAAATPTGDRQAFYQNLYSLRDELQTEGFYETGLTIDNIADKYSDAGNIENAAQTNIAVRYAVTQLNPFVINGPTLLYDTINADHGLDLYDQTSGQGALTSQYLDDRAAMLARLITANQVDQTSFPFQDNPNVDFIDVARGIRLQNSARIPPDQSLYIFGSGGADPQSTLTGGNQNDHIYAGGGNDTIAGGAGSDYLEGGRGDDTYQNLNEGDTVLDLQGSDTYRITSAASTQVSITDMDGQGRVFLESGNTETLLTGGIHLTSDGTAANVYQSLDGQFSYTLSGATLSVSLTGAAGSAPFLTLSDYHDGNLGINLNQEAATNTIITGSGGDETLYLNNSGTSLVVNSGAIQGHDGQTTITYPAAPNRVILNGGNDYLSVLNDLPGLLIYADGQTESGTDGNDTIQLDYLGLNGPPLPDTGNGAIVFGGGGDDLIDGSRRDDVISGGSGVDQLFGSLGNDTLAGGSGNDLLDGGPGADTLMGDANDDQLFGGADNDALIGGSGNDVLFGDSRVGTFGWDGTNYVLDPNLFWYDPKQAGQPVQTFAVIYDEATGSNDTLLGGSGNDRLFGGGGNDQMDGGDNNDTLEGEAGDDTLKGGAGNDTLWGDINPDTYKANQQVFQTLPESTINPDGTTYSYQAQFITRKYVDPVDTAGNDTLDGGSGKDTSSLIATEHGKKSLNAANDVLHREAA